jgi:pyruvate dehydrogenase E1 component alpha subunit
MPNPPLENIFKHVYTDPHPLVQQQQAWLEGYEASFGGDDK